MCIRDRPYAVSVDTAVLRQVKLQRNMACGEEPAVACDGFPDDIVEAAGGDEKILVDFIRAGIIKGLFLSLIHICIIHSKYRREEFVKVD